jgi:2-(1,2-epoxy-1,2-dihydrophenyl)acetyl-CoA isomerase
MNPSISSPSNTVATDVRDNICWISFNRPDALNAITLEMASALGAITGEIKTRSDIRAVVIQGNGKHFMAGGDIPTFQTIIDDASNDGELQAPIVELISEVHRCITNMRTMEQPILGSVRGAVAGAGVSMSLACDLVIASDDTFFNLAYCHLGTSPDGGSTFHLPRAVGLKRSFEIALLGERFDAETAEKWGLINRAVPASDLENETAKLAERLATGPSRAHAGAKRLLNQSLENTLGAQLDLELEQFATCSVTDDFSEGVSAFLGKRKADFKGS